MKAERRRRLLRRLLTAAALLALAALAALFALRPRGQETYLVYGVDQYGSLDESGRSDAMMLVRLDHGRRRIFAVSMARDMLIDNGRGARTKINTLVRKESGEGGDILSEAVARNFGVQPDGWFRVNFSSLVSVVDALGGVTVTLSAEEARYVDREAGYWPGYPLREGECRLCGGQALWFARCRHLDSDLGRGERQSRLAAALVSELRRMNPLRIRSLYESMNHAWRSSLPAAEQAKLVFRALFARRYAVTRLQLPFEGAWRYGKANDVSGVLPDLEENRRLLEEALAP